ncbi:MAG: hypothetical protein JOZ96_13285 [Acidobacteria bacterium]|nr:hypothetical protein [Acidobacteriota bacterium]
MRSLQSSKHGKAPGFFTLCVALCVLAALPLLAGARARTASITIANNSGRTITHIYLSHQDQDDWGPNQLGEATIASGGTYTVNNVSWDQAQVKLVAEDGNGCFSYGVVSAASDSTWTITNDTAADCGL